MRSYLTILLDIMRLERWLAQQLAPVVSDLKVLQKRRRRAERQFQRLIRCEPP